MLRLILFSILDNSYCMQGYKKRSKDSGISKVYCIFVKFKL